MKLSTKGIATFVLAVMVAFCMVVAPKVAHADEEESLEELEQRVLDTTAAYEEALARVDKVEASITENEEKIAGIEAELPAKRARAAESLRTQYKMQQSSNSLLELLLSSENFFDMLSTLEYLEHVQAHNNEAVIELLTAQAELQEARDVLAAEKSAVQTEAEHANEARQAAIGVREEAKERAFERARREAAAAEAATQAARERAGQEFETASGGTAKVEAPDPEQSIPTREQVEAPKQEEQEQPETQPKQQAESEAEPVKEEQQAEVEEPKKEEPAAEEPAEEPAKEDKAASTDLEDSGDWAARIDAYLEGSPLEGYGATFAEAAANYGVDPRWSPAIACIESGKGSVCFEDHNAWGWGSDGWSSWEEAIDSQVAGLASVYGYTISPSAAEMYCPDTAQEWYSSVLAEMNDI